MAVPWQRPADQRLDQLESVAATEVRERPFGGDAGVVNQCFSQTVGELSAYGGKHGPRSPCPERIFPLGIAPLCPLDGNLRRRRGFVERSDRDMRHVEHRRSAVAVMCK